MSMLRLDDVWCAHGRVVALRGIAIEVNAGSLVCILGANGAGKSTTLRAISGQVKAVRGRITFDGRDITRLRPAARVARGIAHCPEGRRVFADLTVKENLVLGGHILSRVELQRGIDRALSLFPTLAERMRQAAGSLSGGEQQMLAIGRALMTEPRLLLLDEPSLGLAPLVTQHLFRTLGEVRTSGTTILLVEQNVSLALAIADYAYVLANGRIDLAGTAEEVRATNEVERSYLGTAAP